MLNNTKYGNFISNLIVLRRLGNKNQLDILTILFPDKLKIFLSQTLCLIMFIKFTSKFGSIKRKKYKHFMVYTGNKKE